MGNPRAYWTFADEGANRSLAAIAESSHASTWERWVLSKWAWVCTAHKRKRWVAGPAWGVWHGTVCGDGAVL